jgi:hypothetical protein
LQSYLAKITTHRFGGGAVSGIAAATALRRVLGIAEVFLHLDLQECLDGQSDQVLKNRFGVEGLGSTLGADLGDQQLLERLRVLNESGKIGNYVLPGRRALRCGG